jgi:excisionase family DNA binding protein
MLHERLGFSPDVIEAQLAHSVRDNLGRAYNRTEFIEQRRAMLQRWADYLDELRLSADTAKPVDEASGERADPKGLLTPQAAADLVNISRHHMVRHIDSGDIPVVMVGNRQRVRKQDVLAWHERAQDESP